MIGRDLERRGARCATRFLYPSSGCSVTAKLWRVITNAGKLARAAPDVLITFQPTASAIATMAGRLGGCRVPDRASIEQSGQITPCDPRADKILGTVGAYCVTIANSRATISRIRRLSGTFYRKRIPLIEHGIPPPVFAFGSCRILSPFRFRATGAIAPDGRPVRPSERSAHHCQLPALICRVFAW